MLRVTYNIPVMQLIYIGPGEGVNCNHEEALKLNCISFKAEQNIHTIW